MKLSTQDRHAIMSMLALALLDGRDALRLQDMAGQQAVSVSYLEQIFAKLRHAGLVEGMRGPCGGYRLGNTPTHISIAEVVRAMDGNAPRNLHGRRQGGATEMPQAQQGWEGLSAQLYVFLEGLTLAGLVSGHQQPGKAHRLGGAGGAHSPHIGPLRGRRRSVY